MCVCICNPWCLAARTLNQTFIKVTFEIEGAIPSGLSQEKMLSDLF